MAQSTTQSQSSAVAAPQYTAKSYDHLIGMPGFSEKLLTTHFKLYQGYVTNSNLALETLNRLLTEGREKSPEYAEVRRRLGWEMNGMRLHEYYFDNLGGKTQLTPENRLSQLIASNFGSFENWKKDFVASGAMRGIGWVILYQDPNTSRLINFWIEEHATNHLVGGRPIVVMDVFEHAYMTDYGTDKAKYINAFFENLNWDVISKRVS